MQGMQGNSKISNTELAFTFFEYLNWLLCMQFELVPVPVATAAAVMLLFVVVAVQRLVPETEVCTLRNGASQSQVASSLARLK